MSDTENEQAELILRLDAALVEVTGQRDALLEACKRLRELYLVDDDVRANPHCACYVEADERAGAAIAKTEEAKP